MRKIFDKIYMVIYAVGLNIYISFNIFKTRRKFSHDNGVCAAGKLKIVENPAWPEIEFFVPGKEFPCRVRHGMASFDDDAKMLVRGGSVKFSDENTKSPFDLVMNTGDAPLFNSIRTFAEFGKAFAMKPGPDNGWEFRGVNWIPYMQKYPGCFRGMKESLRRDPSSYAQLFYHSKMPIHYRSKDKATRYVKFRMIPGNRGPETGLLDEEDRKTPWNQMRRPGNTKSRNYLKHEFAERVKNEGVTYILQLQLHEWKEGDTDVVFDSLVPWDEKTHPWLDLAEIKLDRVLTYEEERLTYFAISNHPKCLGIISAKNIDDPNSLNYLRYWATIPRKARLLGQYIFGNAKEITDTYWGWLSGEESSSSEKKSI